MVLFKRKIEGEVRKRMFKGRAILIFGPRQAGKTTLAKKILNEFGETGGYFNCELASVRKAFVPGEPERIKKLIGGKNVVVFDEAQTIQDIGVILKAFIDTYTRVQVIATGSSSFDLANKINEPLTGRAFEFTLLPLSIDEARNAYPNTTRTELNEFMRLGMYPAIIGEKNTVIKEDILKNLATNYLYKDIYTFESIRDPRVFEDLVKALALQVGSTVSYSELSKLLGVSRATVEKYVRLLEQSYVVKVVRSFSRNPRTEIRKAFKVFFYDTGIRNAIIDNIASVDSRSDMGQVFENFFVSERMKRSYYETGARVLFWRNRQGEEIDVVETIGEDVYAFECKWNDRARVRKPGQFLKAYSEAKFDVVTPITMLRDK